VFVLAALFVGGAGATKRTVRATLTHALQSSPAGTKVAVAWRLRDGLGHAVFYKHVFVKITCPEGTDSTTAYANPGSGGIYLAKATVPPGGIGTVAIGRGRSLFPVTNPYHG